MVAAQLALFPDETPDAETPAPLLAPVRVQRGDLWQCGRHRVLCGDATCAEDVARLTGGARASLLIADPPYGMRLDASYRNSTPNSRKHIKASRGYAPVRGDDRDYDPRPVMALFRHCCEQFWWGADYYRKRLPDGGSFLVWDKRVGLESLKYSSAEFEMCWSMQSHHRRILRARWFGLCGTETQDVRRRIHPTQKPLEVYLPIIEQYSKPCAVVADPYLGSGTTLIACERTGRACYGIEIEPHYCNIILRRWEQATGQTATLLASIP